MSQFSKDIVKFNDIYKLPINTVPTLNIGTDVVTRLNAFRDIMDEEIMEIVPIIEAINDGADQADVLTAIADLLVDIQIYCASELLKFGIPMDKVQEIIMQSNFSKLGADGLPIYDERGKVQKGPSYYTPEPEIKVLIENLQKA